MAHYMSSEKMYRVTAKHVNPQFVLDNEEFIAQRTGDEWYAWFAPCESAFDLGCSSTYDSPVLAVLQLVRSRSCTEIEIVEG